jgi:separase
MRDSMGVYGATSPPEHLFLALDKNVSPFPWESIPILRGRAVSRIPSLPFLLDQVEMMKHLSVPSALSASSALASSAGQANGALGNASMSSSRTIPMVTFDGKRKIDTNRVFYILNPSGDLERTQMYFEAWIESMKPRGWKGIVGRSPTELEMVDALTNYDLVL